MRQWLETLAPTGPVASTASDELRSHAQSRVGADAVAWAAEVTASVVAHLTVERTDPAGAMEIAGARGCEECLLTTLVGLADQSGDVITPEAALDDARVAARASIPLENLLRIVWACHAAVEQLLLERIAASIAPTSVVDEVRDLVAMLAVFIDRYVTDISATYAHERLESESRLLVERRRIVDAVLDGIEPPANAESLLGITWEHHHVAAMAWSSGGNRVFHSEDSAYRFGERVARQLGASWLVIERGDHVEFHWSFARAGQFDLAAVDAARPARMRLALGPVIAGVAGFAASTTAARRTRVVGLAMREPPDVLRYEDVSYVALLIADRQQAREFVHRELAGLLGPDPMSEAIRETLRHFLLGGRSRQVAAQATHVATTTVAYRVKRAEELLGRSTFDRTQQTIAALELLHAFPALAGLDVAGPQRA
ncbi:MAG: helix-turn-helix domain-containing protein [Microbacterium sp.]|uniref:PucR family transcriptional regulator n=1 Tax=Microbacterium sp. TaxID=51671 RepID=UPI0039E61CD0